MLLTTTNNIEGKRITQYYGIVTGETIIGANVFRDFMAGIRDFFGGRSGSYEKVLREAKDTAGIRDFFGGRSGSYEKVLREAKDTALQEMTQEADARGANAVIGIDLDYETVGESGSMLMVTASGTAVRVE